MRHAINDPEKVRAEYRDESRYETRVSIWSNLEGPDPKRLALDAVAEAVPRRVLEVGAGPGREAAVIRDETGAEVVLVDQSERMVEMARELGLDARLGDVQELPFEDGTFDCAYAGWMLYHVPDVDRGIAELARVLRTGGRLVAGTNSERNLIELWRLRGTEGGASRPFSSESGEAQVRRHFPRVERRDIPGRLTFPDRAAAYAYVSASPVYRVSAERLPEWDGPLVCTCLHTIFVAET